MGNNDKLRQDYINSLDSFIADNPVVNGLDTFKFRDFLIGLVEHESSFNPNARQGSYYGWYQTNKYDSDPYKQHLNAFNHLSDLFKNTITQADIMQARKLGINDAALMLKYWNQGNRVNNYIWNNRDAQDGLGTKISEYGNDLTVPLDVYNYAMKNIYGDYTVKSGDSWFNIQKRVRIPGRDYNAAGKDLWNMQDTTGIYGLLKPGQKFSFGDDPNVNNSILNTNKIKALSNKVNPDWYSDMIKRRDTNNLNQSLYYQNGGALVYRGFNSEEFENDNFRKAKDLDIEDFKIPVYNERFPVESVRIYKPISIEFQNIVEPQTDDGIGKIYKSTEKETFKQDMYNAYVHALKKKGIHNSEEFAKRIVTQDILESNWGQSSLSKDFNFGGIKDFNGNGSLKDTIEYINGIKTTMKQPFRRFKNLNDYVNYKVDLVEKNWNVFAYSPEQYFNRLVSGTKKYATDPNYSIKLNKLYNQIWG